MNICGISVSRPVATLCALIVIVLLGINSYRNLGLDNMPDIEIPFVTITTVYPGASPGEVEVDVAKRIEDAVSTIDGVAQLYSTCMEGVVMTLIEFDLSVDVDVAAVDVRERLDLIMDDFPADVESPKILKFDPNSKPVATLVLSGDMPLDELYDYADEVLSDRFTTIAGVADVRITGGGEMELLVVVEPESLAAVNLYPGDVVETLLANNAKIPVGNIRDGRREIAVTFDAELRDFRQFEELEIDGGDGRRVLLGDVARIEIRAKEKRTLAFLEGRPVVNMQITKKGEANAVKVVERVRAEVANLSQPGSLPGGMELRVFSDDGKFIQANVDDAWSSIFAGVLLTAAILMLFLHEFRSTLIVTISMPISIIATFAVMSVIGYTFNNITLLALGTSVGVLVANSIVVLENIAVKAKGGLDPRRAAEIGGGEVVAPVLASALTNVVVFVPVAMMSSLVGRFFTPFAVIMTAVSIISLFVSFTLTPVLAAMPWGHGVPRRSRPVAALVSWLESFYDMVEGAYWRSLEYSARRPWLTPVAAAALLVATIVLIGPLVGSAFFPDNDRGEFIVKAEFPAYYNIAETTRRAAAMEAKLMAFPEAKSCSTVVGWVQGIIGQNSEGVYLAEITVLTSGKKERAADLEEMRAAIRKLLADETDCLISVNVPSFVGGASTMLEMEIVGDDLAVLADIGRQLAATARRSGLAVDVDTSIRVGKPEKVARPIRPILRDLELDAADVGRDLRGHVEGLKAGTFKIGDRSLDIRVVSVERPDETRVGEFTIATRNGAPVALDAAVAVADDVIPIQINRSNKRRIEMLFANPAAGVALGDLVAFIDAEAAALTPPGYSHKFVGQVEKMQETQIDFIEAIIAATILTYLVIAAILESWTQPLIIMATLPLALIGMLAMLFATGQPLSMMGLLGAVMLIGIVVNNAILIMDEVNQRRRGGGEDPQTAILGASRRKFRPIIMTSLAAVIGVAPMAFGSGLGSELRQSCGIGVVGGLLSSTFMSLYVIPMGYLAAINVGKSISGWRKKYSPAV